MMGRMAALGVAMMLAAGCVDSDAPEDGVETQDPALAPADALNPEAIPPDDGDLREVNVTLTEWSVALSQETVSAGAIGFVVRNTGSVVHRFEVEGNGEEWASEDINPGDEVTMSLNLVPGTYEVYCPVVAGGVNHEERGMTTTLRVN